MADSWRSVSEQQIIITPRGDRAPQQLALRTPQRPSTWVFIDGDGWKIAGGEQRRIVTFQIDTTVAVPGLDHFKTCFVPNMVLVGFSFEMYSRCMLMIWFSKLRQRYGNVFLAALTLLQTQAWVSVNRVISDTFFRPFFIPLQRDGMLG